MISIKRNINFILEKPKDGVSRLRCVVTWNSMRLRIGVGHNVDPEGWDDKEQRCRKRFYHGKNKTPSSLINRDMDELEEFIDKTFLEFEQKNTVPEKEVIRTKIEAYLHPECIKETEELSLFKVFDLYMADGMRNGNWSKSNETKYKTLRRHLYAMDRKLTFDKLIGGASNFISYLGRVTDQYGAKGLSNRTIKKYLDFVKTFLRWAEREGYCHNISRFADKKNHLRTSKRPVVFLTWDELMTLYNYEFIPGSTYDRVRDVFCFCCFTSLRYSDAENLRRSDVTEDNIHITTVKTSDALTIELNKYSKSILDKYKGLRFPGGKALPVMSNQKMNEYLKEIGKICNFDKEITLTTYKGAKRIDHVCKKWELLSTHVGRRTFVCNALMMGIPPSIVMKWTGHSDYEAMRPYIEIADEAKRNAMKAFDNKE